MAVYLSRHYLLKVPCYLYSCQGHPWSISIIVTHLAINFSWVSGHFQKQTIARILITTTKLACLAAVIPAHVCSRKEKTSWNKPEKSTPKKSCRSCCQKAQRRYREWLMSVLRLQSAVRCCISRNNRFRLRERQWLIIGPLPSCIIQRRWRWVLNRGKAAQKTQREASTVPTSGWSSNSNSGLVQNAASKNGSNCCWGAIGSQASWTCIEQRYEFIVHGELIKEKKYCEGWTCSSSKAGSQVPTGPLFSTKLLNAT